MKKLTRILFMGTPEFAVPVLAALQNAAPGSGFSIVGVATQPDRPAGRGKQPAASPVKIAAEEIGLRVLQPPTLRKAPDAVEDIRALAPDVIVVAAYGLILPKSVLEIAPCGCINLHASLLPQWRGASPIAAAILEGAPETGVSIMLMDEGMDTGPVLAQRRRPMHGDETGGTLSAGLAALGAAALIETLPMWLAGEIAPIPQTDLPGEPSICRLIHKEDGRIDWRQPAAQVERMARAYTPWPGAYTTWRGQPFRILRAAVAAGTAPPGLVGRAQGRITVGTGDGLLVLQSVQPAGRRALAVDDFLNGAAGFVGETLGVEREG